MYYEKRAVVERKFFFWLSLGSGCLFFYLRRLQKISLFQEFQILILPLDLWRGAEGLLCYTSQSRGGETKAWDCYVAFLSLVLRFLKWRWSVTGGTELMK